mgnify:CR=1 FL=1
MSYLKPNISNQKFSEILKYHISENKPLSMSRFGDGEIMFIKRCLPLRLKSQFCSRWGYKLNDFKIGENLVLEILNRSLRDTDILGFMNSKNDICKSLNGCKKEIWSLPKEKITSLGRSKEIMVCDHQVSRSKELGNLNNLKNIINGNKICLVSPRTKTLKNIKLENILDCEINFINVPYEYKLTDRDKVLSYLENINENIVILSLGLLGKDFPSYLANQKGKIALDFGATVDAWAGIKSRPWFDNLQNHCLIKK